MNKLNWPKNVQENGIETALMFHLGLNLAIRARCRDRRVLYQCSKCKSQYKRSFFQRRLNCEATIPMWRKNLARTHSVLRKRCGAGALKTVLKVVQTVKHHPIFNAFFHVLEKNAFSFISFLVHFRLMRWISLFLSKHWHNICHILWRPVIYCCSI